MLSTHPMLVLQDADGGGFVVGNSTDIMPGTRTYDTLEDAFAYLYALTCMVPETTLCIVQFEYRESWIEWRRAELGDKA